MSFRFEKLSVLVVEDTAPMRVLMSSVLSTLGVGMIYTAKDGDSGFVVFCNQNPDIVITDWHMPPTSGIDLIRKIRTDSKSPNKTVPIIIMTGYSSIPKVSEARDMGTTEFLVKPFTANDLIVKIAHIINKPRDFIDAEHYLGPDRRRRIMDNYEGPGRRRKDSNDWKDYIE